MSLATAAGAAAEEAAKKLKPSKLGSLFRLGDSAIFSTIDTIVRKAYSRLKPEDQEVLSDLYAKLKEKKITLRVFVNSLYALLGLGAAGKGLMAMFGSDDDELEELNLSPEELAVLQKYIKPGKEELTGVAKNRRGGVIHKKILKVNF